MESNGRQAVKSLRVGCMDVGYSINDGYEDSVEGILLIELFSEVRVPLRYVLQWKQRTFALGFYDESPWITSSVEVDQAVAVQGMIPGVQYCFMVTAVDADGIFGIPVVSDWVEALDVDASPRLPSPEPMELWVRDLSDGKVAVRWTPPNDKQIITYYEVLIYSLDKRQHCSMKPLAFTANNVGRSTFAIVMLPTEYKCKYLFRVIGYDPNRRQAIAQLRRTYPPNIAHNAFNPFLILISLVSLCLVIIVMRIRYHKAVATTTAKDMKLPDRKIVVYYV
ncbi:unnamed protein product [Toxocara canis]|uniref:Fibronectin type-III domain-containing protein n=1 Tax=Toxocara canis TaxID=6265 RepID=A0A183VDF4_TOXCA|nr:unnamed protein product [Toxocara canis]